MYRQQPKQAAQTTRYSGFSSPDSPRLIRSFHIFIISTEFVILAEESDSDEEMSSKTPKLNGAEERRSSRRKTDSSPPSNSRLSSTRRSRANEDLLLDTVSIGKLIDEVSKNENSWPFLRPVSRYEVPDYHKVIKNPMDLAKIKSKLNTGQYSTNSEVMRDIQLIFYNCDLYNQNESEIYL